MEILHLDREIAVLLKAAGELSEGEGTSCLPALLAAALAARGEPNAVYPVHRLDRGTAGLIVYARTPRAAASLSEAIREGKLAKEYLAVAEGAPAPAAAMLTDLLYFDRARDKSYVVDRLRRGVKEARLAYETLAHTEADGRTLSLLRVKLFTGRTHQIRVQLAHRRHPLCGDARYGAKTRGELALFSHTLTLPHPKNGREWSIAALPAPVGFFSPFADFFASPAPLSDCPN